MVHGDGLYLDINDFANDEASNNNEGPAGVKQLLSRGIVKEEVGVSGTEQVDERKQHDREERQNPTGETALRRMGAHLALDADTFANNVRGATEDLGQIPTRLFLHQDRGDEELQVLRRNARAHLEQRITEVNA